MPIQGEAWDKLIKRLIGFIANCFRIDCTAVACSPPVIFGSTVIASSALGVVGNIARWGHSNQIQDPGIPQGISNQPMENSNFQQTNISTPEKRKRGRP